MFIWFMDNMLIWSPSRYNCQSILQLFGWADKHHGSLLPFLSSLHFFPYILEAWKCFRVTWSTSTNLLKKSLPREILFNFADHNNLHFSQRNFKSLNNKFYCNMLFKCCCGLKNSKIAEHMNAERGMGDAINLW